MVKAYLHVSENFFYISSHSRKSNRFALILLLVARFSFLSWRINGVCFPEKYHHQEITALWQLDGAVIIGNTHIKHIMGIICDGCTNAMAFAWQFIFINRPL